MNVIQAKPSDTEQVFQLLVKSAVWLKEICPEQWPMDWLISKQQEIVKSIDAGLFYIVKIEDEISAVFEIKTDQELIWENDETQAYYVHKLAICRKFKSLGLGATILKHIFDKARNNHVPVVRLDCVRANQFLKRYYLEQGFVYKGAADDEGEEVLLFEYAV